LTSGATVYDHLNGASAQRQSYLHGAHVTATNLPAVVFNDASCLTIWSSPRGALHRGHDWRGSTDTHVFNPTLDSVYINGQFANWYAWAARQSPPAPAGYQMIEEGRHHLYNTLLLAAGTPRVAYKYVWMQAMPTRSVR